MPTRLTGVLTDAMGRISVPRIDSEEPFVPLAGGRQVSLFQGAVQLDLSQAALRFADGRDAGK